MQSLVLGNITEVISNIKLKQYLHIKDVTLTNLVAVLSEKPTGAPQIAVLTYNASNSLCTVPMYFWREFFLPSRDDAASQECEKLPYLQSYSDTHLSGSPNTDDKEITYSKEKEKRLQTSNMLILLVQHQKNQHSPDCLSNTSYFP